MCHPDRASSPPISIITHSQSWHLRPLHFKVHSLAVHGLPFASSHERLIIEHSRHWPRPPGSGNLQNSCLACSLEIPSPPSSRRCHELICILIHPRASSLAKGSHHPSAGPVAHCCTLFSSSHKHLNKGCRVLIARGYLRLILQTKSHSMT